MHFEKMQSGFENAERTAEIMIIKDNLEFHAAELRKAPGLDGWLPIRIPAEIGGKLSPRGRFIAMDTVTTEIRFITDAPTVDVSLSAVKPEFGVELLEVRVFYGNFEAPGIWLKPGVVTTFRLTPQNAAIRGIKTEYLRKGPGIGFAPNVIRLVSQRGGMIYCGINTFGAPVRPPEPTEKPAKTCLFYGSSITNSHLDGYPSVACKALGTDIINLGMCGSCQIEPELAEWMAARSDWDLAVFELGINILWMEPGEFRRRADHLLKAFLSRRPEKPVVLLTLFPSKARFEFAEKPDEENKDAAFCEILRDLHTEYSEKGNVHLIEGKDILTDLNGLGADFLHPKIYGHAVMGLNLAKKLAPLLSTETKKQI